MRVHWSKKDIDEFLQGNYYIDNKLVLKIKAVAQLTKLSESAISQREKRGRFPIAVKFNRGNNIGWFKKDVENWIKLNKNSN